MTANRLGSPAAPAATPTPLSRTPITTPRANCEALSGEGRSLGPRLNADETISHGERPRQELDHPPVNRSAATASERLRTELGMTTREVEVALLLAEGLPNSMLARRLGISPHTARHHTQRVLRKLGVHSRSEAGARMRHDGAG